MCSSFPLFGLPPSLTKSVHADRVLQGSYDNRTIFNSLDQAWSLLRIFPRELLRRITVKTLDEWYERKEEH